MSSKGRKKDSHREAHPETAGRPRSTKVEEENAEQVIKHEGLLFQRWYSRDRPEEVFDQVVLPHSYCLNVLTLAQYVLMAAHLRRKRTAKWILKWF